MSSFNAKEFFKQQKELMNLSDDDRDERYVARMTGNKLLNEKEDVDMIDLTEFDNVQYTSTPATSCLKRKTTRSIPLPSSPRIKRSKIAPNLPSVELDAQSTSYHIDEDATTESLASQASQETIIIDDDDEEPFLKAKSTPPLTVSDSSMVRSSPIDDTSNIFIVVAPKNTEQKKSVHVEAKHAANRKTIRKPIPVFQLQQPRADPANETSNH
ncbi:hypothetical protein BT96DRAFT_318623 [Gymnopus androsaceus JB14]|uniref:Uncharacterized protein n=1 Tax=Gymnopus androsaceus JB14 TaxID=1447944 RepID=A0A6A4H1G1_9AGAR|nr:hypothetical protein BT96DRAFT_318623 [Gymnopus androsaceus JB14]